MADSFTRALWSSGVWLATAYGLGMVVGANLNASDVLVDAGIMGAATFGSDFVHNVIGLIPTTASSALVSGSFYAGAQKAYRDDSNYVVNLVAGAANDVVVDYVGNMYYARSAMGAVEDGGDGVVLSAA
jgi:hypothetical protein